MTTDRDPRTHIVLSWLREDAHEDAERLLLRALDDVETTPQRRPLWSAWRSFDMTIPVRVGASAAAVLAVAFLGMQLLAPGLPGTGGTDGPSATPLPTAAVLRPGTGPLDGGRYAWYWSGRAISFEVPEGWVGRFGTELVKHPDGPGEINWSALLGDGLPVTHVYSDACKSRGALKPVAGTVESLVDALDAQIGTDATVTDVTLGGRPAKRVELVQSPGVDRASCSHGAAGPLQIWADPAQTDFYAFGPGYSGFADLLDIDGAVVVFTVTVGPDAPPADIEELEAILASVEIAPTAEPSPSGP